MINLDWFQPFDSASYSIGAIYGVICNLPREVRFKKENMLILSLLPGPDEVKLHKINHYLALIVDELLEFGVVLIYLLQPIIQKAKKSGLQLYAAPTTFRLLENCAATFRH